MTLANDEFVFSDELPLIDDDGPEQLDFWKILIVDDDQDVHLATKHALQNTDLIGKVPLFLNAYSTADCLKLLSEHSDIAVILLDVVMEAEDSGLQLVGIIRNQLNLKFPRIILRTGQPGYAPELDAVRDYDINDYKTKTELTRNKLFITVLSAIRSYDQLNRITQPHLLAPITFDGVEFLNLSNSRPVDRLALQRGRWIALESAVMANDIIHRPRARRKQFEVQVFDGGMLLWRC